MGEAPEKVPVFDCATGDRQWGIRRDTAPISTIVENVFDNEQMTESEARQNVLRGLFALAGSGGAQVDEVAAVRGAVPDPGLVLGAVVEDHRAGGIPAGFEAGPQSVLLGDQDVGQHGATQIRQLTVVPGDPGDA
jgi:hypothetical protein